MNRVVLIESRSIGMPMVASTTPTIRLSLVVISRVGPRPALANWALTMCIAIATASSSTSSMPSRRLIRSTASWPRASSWGYSWATSQRSG